MSNFSKIVLASNNSGKLKELRSMLKPLARFAGHDATDELNNQKLLEVLAETEDTQRAAHFRCALALVRHAEDPIPIICEGVWYGKIMHQAKGTKGFGYDPLFFVKELAKASAELSPEVKNQHSHRAKALALLVKQIS